LAALLPSPEEGDGVLWSEWAGYWATGRKLLGRRDGNQRKKVSGRKERVGQKQGRIDWDAEFFFQFFKQRFEFKSQGFKYFQTRFELRPNLDKLK
jgi:hypothetical protein